MYTKVRYSLTFIKTVCAKTSETLEVYLGLNLDGGFGVELGFKYGCGMAENLINKCLGDVF